MLILQFLFKERYAINNKATFFSVHTKKEK